MPPLVLAYAAPLLRELGVDATFFVCRGFFGNTEGAGYSPEGRVLTRDEAGELAELGFDLGAHSTTHPDLVELAYPFGLHDARVRAATQAAGFELAYQYAPGPWAPFAVPRVPKPAY